MVLSGSGPYGPKIGQYDPLKGPLHYQQSTLKVTYSPKILHKIVLPENWFISSFFEVKMIKKCPNVIYHAILTNFGTIWPIQRSLPYQQCMLNGSCSHKILHKIVLPANQKMYSFLSFLKWKCSKSAENVMFHAFLANLGPYDPFRGPLQYQKGIFKG